MRVSKFIITSLLLLFGFPNTAFAQFSLYHELGIIAGPVFFKSDYGQRGDLQTNAENSGYGIGIVHYLNFAYTSYHHDDFASYLREHVKVRSELSYSDTYFQHWGKYIEHSSTSTDAMQLRQMRGETKIMNLGFGIEFSLFKDIHEFESSEGGFGPFAGLGMQYSHYEPEVYSKLGSLDDPGVLYPKFIGGISNNDGNTGSLVVNVGTRYKINVMSDLIIDLRGQYYFSDWVDGLNPPINMNPSNMYNDWNIWLSVGYIHYLDDDL